MKNWPRLKMAEIAPIIRREVMVSTEEEYPELGIRSFGKGTFHKPALKGSDAGSKRLFEIHAGDLIFSNVFAWEGAIAIATKDDHGRFGSHRFISCQVDQSQARAEYIKYYLTCSQEGIAQIQAASPGGAGRNRTLGLGKLGEITIPLPPLQEQCSILDKIERLQDKTRQLNEHLAAIEADAANLLRTFVFGCTERRLLADLVRQKSPDITVNPSQTYQFAGVYSFGRGVFKSACKTGSEFAYPRLSTVNKGNFIYPKLMAWEGALGVVPEECDGMVVSPEFPVFEVNQDLVIPEVLDIYFKTPTVWQALAEISGGTNMRRRRLQPSAFLAHRIPVPSPTIQKAIRSLHQKLQEVRARNSQISAANDALIPATLERVFLR